MDPEDITLDEELKLELELEDEDWTTVLETPPVVTDEAVMLVILLSLGIFFF